MPLAHIAEVYDRLHEAGARHGLVDLGSYAFNGLRMEKAFLGSGELTTDVGMFDVGLEQFFRPENRDFIGREASLAAAKSPGWELFYAEIHSAGIDVHGGEPVLLDGAPVGLTTSGGCGYTVGMSLGWLFVRRGTPREGLTVQLLNREHAVTVLDEPAYDPGNLRPRADD